MDTLTISRTEGRVLILHLTGRLDTQTHELLLREARAAHAAGSQHLLLDLQNVRVITSSGLGALQRIFRLFTPEAEVRAWNKENRGVPYKSPYFKIAAASADVAFVLNVAGFLQNIAIYPSVAEALDSF